MSDSLKKLLGVEKQAAELVEAAEAEARARTSDARAEAQKAKDALAKAKAVENERALEAETRALADEKKKRQDDYRAELALLPADPEALGRVLSRLLGKGS